MPMAVKAAMAMGLGAAVESAMAAAMAAVVDKMAMETAAAAAALADIRVREGMEAGLLPQLHLEAVAGAAAVVRAKYLLRVAEAAS